MAINSGDTAWVLLSAALVLLMTPGLAFFYAGLVSERNVLTTLLYSFLCAALVTVQWIVIGYTLAFGPTVSGLIGGLDWIGLNGVTSDPNPDYAPGVPHIAFMLYMGMFAVIAPTIVTRAFANRIRLSAFVAFVLLWATLVYDPLAHWTWAAGGWIRELGALDFAGGTVVHVSSGLASLAAAVVFKRRADEKMFAEQAHNIPFVVLGASLLWFGWFGWTAGGALAANGVAANVVVATNASAAAGVLGWSALSAWRTGKVSVIGAASGAVAGLVAITPASGFVGALPALAIGLVAGLVSNVALQLVTTRFGGEDTLDVMAVHGATGIWGALATGIFASFAVNGLGADGLIAGNATLIGKQVVAIVAAGAYSFVLTWVILKVLDLVIGLRPRQGQREQGADVVTAGEKAYVR